MTPEQLRLEIVNALDKILGMPRWIVGAEQQRIAQAQRAFWMAPDAPLDKILALMPRKEAT